MNARIACFGALASLLLLTAACSAPDAQSISEPDDDLDTTSAELSLCKKAKCGPPLGMPAYLCSDGSIGGNTGRCIREKGTCHWEIRECPTTKPPPPPPPPPPACTSNADCPGLAIALCDPCPDGSCKQNLCVNGTCQLACATKPPPPPPPPACKSDADCPGLMNPVCQPCADGSCKENRCVNGACQLACPDPNQCGKNTCKPSQTCCSGMPFPEPTCIDGTICPISERKHKKDISYLSSTDAQRLNDELLGFRLATYRYKTEGANERPHLGFIIDDVAPSPAVMSSGERVDMYGYQTMTVAALQTQAREIAALRKQVEDLKRELRTKK